MVEAMWAELKVFVFEKDRFAEHPSPSPPDLLIGSLSPKMIRRKPLSTGDRPGATSPAEQPERSSGALPVKTTVEIL
jgi:hypothetical protein